MTASKSQITSSDAKDAHTPKARKSRVSQSDVPSLPLQEALRVAQVLADDYAKGPTKPLNVAKSLNLSPGSSTFRMLLSASVAYGLTEGSFNATVISLTELGRRIVAPTIEGMEQEAKREALLKPRIIKEFLTRYNNNKIPSDNIAKNVLEDMGVPNDSTEQTLKLILSGAKTVGIVSELKGSWYIDLDNVPSLDKPMADEESRTGAHLSDDMSYTHAEEISPSEKGYVMNASANSQTNNRVFITHGKNTEIVNQLKELLTFGSFVPVVAAEHETVSKPVPDKVMDDMRSCYAAIIHVGKEVKLLDQEGQEHIFLNQNVLIEIGAAMALYGRRFILLVERGAMLPSNLQGLYEVRYEGNKLDYDATMKLLKAFNDFKG